jgi:alpha-methylacyl-CoA racemase
MVSGPLNGLKILEFAGLGPVPFCGMLLTDLGADVLRIERPGWKPTLFDAVIGRGRASVTIDLKNPEGIERCLAFAEQADALIEGFRPGVMERLGLGPDVVCARNPRIVYGRMTGWGQTGPLAQAAGHDINYLALSGALHAIGPADRPVPPLNLVADFGGGALYLAFGLLAAILSARTNGVGQVVDCAMTDGAASLMALTYGMHAAGNWRDEREANLLDGGAPYYGTFRCSDGKWISIGSLEPQFYSLLLDKLGLDELRDVDRDNRANWPLMRARIERAFLGRTRDEWCLLLEGTDICFAPVLSLAEAPEHAHNRARKTFLSVDGVVQPAPAPRFSKTPGAVQPSRRNGWTKNRP